MKHFLCCYKLEALNVHPVMFSGVKLAGLLHPDLCISLPLLQMAFRLQLLPEVSGD